MRTDGFDFDTLTPRDGHGSAKWAIRTDGQKTAGVVPLSVADMEFPPPPVVKAALEDAVAHGIYGYTEAGAPYLDAVAGWMAARHDWRIEKEWIVPENGVVPSFSVAVRAFTEPGGGVLLQPPVYHPFAMMIEQNGRIPVTNPLRLGGDGRYHMDLDDLRRKAAQSGAKLMFLCSPHNPVGRVWTVEELRGLAEICREFGILVVSDEIHFDLEIAGKHTVFLNAAPEMADHCVICTAPSKTFNIAGLHQANMIIPGKAARERYAARLAADGSGGVSYFGYHATIAAYTGGGPWLDALLAYVRDNFAFFDAWLKENLPAIRLLPVEGTYLAWTDCRALGLDDASLLRFMADDALLALDEGTLFGEGGEGFMRWNLALPRAELGVALERLLAAAKRRRMV